MEKPDTNRRVAERYARAGHPSIEELVAEQGTRFRADPVDLLGDFWPEDESIEDFLSRAQSYLPLLRNRKLLVSFITEAELEQWILLANASTSS